MQIEIAVIGWHLYDLFSLDQLFPHPPMRDQTLDGADAQPMFLAKPHQFRQACHRPVVVQNFAEDTGGLEPGHSREIDRRFSMTGATQDATVLRSQRKDVSWLH